MSLNQTILIVLTVILLSIGQVLFKMAALKIDFKNGIFLSSFFEPILVLALVVYLVATFAWILVLRSVPLSSAYPFAALAFFVVPTLAFLFLGENVSLKTYVGAVVISVGVYLSAS